MKELNYSLLVLLAIPYMIVILKMLLHFISYIVYRISSYVYDRKRNRLDCNFAINEFDKQIQKNKFLKIKNNTYKFNNWFNSHLRFFNFSGWCGYCILSGVLLFITISLSIRIKSDYNEEKLLLDNNFEVIRQYENFEDLPMWKYDRVGVIKNAVECNEKYFKTENGKIKCKLIFIKPENLKDLKPINVNKMLNAAGISKDVEKIINDKYSTYNF